MICYSYDPTTKQFIGSEEAFASPLEEGVFLLPANATFVEPPEVQIGQVAVFNGSIWHIDEVAIPPKPEPETPPAPTWASVREKRNRLLGDCDWTQMPDSPLDADKVAAWKTYRQTLRNIPETFSTPEAVVWPSTP